MNHCFPSAVIGDGTLAVRFSDSVPYRSVEIACIVDLTDFGDVVGIEVLDWRRQLSGGLIDAPVSCGKVRWAYDAEIDALYIHLMDGVEKSAIGGVSQESAVGRASLDSNRRVVLLEVPVPPAI